MAKKSRERKPDVQWFKSRLKSAGLQIKDAAEEFGLPPNKLWQMLATRRRVQPEELATWARILKAPMSTIFKQLDYPWEAGGVPVDGIVAATGVIKWRDPAVDGAGHFSAPYPEGGIGELHALVLEAAVSGLGRGSVFYFEPYDRVDRASFGRLAVITRGEGLDSYLAIPDTVDEGRSTLRLFADVAVDVDRIISATPVRWIQTGV